MSNRRVIQARVHLGVRFAILISALSLVSCQGITGSTGSTVFANGTNITGSTSGISNGPSPGSIPSTLPSAPPTASPTPSASASVPSQPSIGSIASAVATAVDTPYLAGNTVQYYCDCSGPNQSCAAAGSTEGNDTTGAGTKASPYKSIDAAMTWLNGGSHRTAALCRGGSFTPSGTSGYWLAALSCPVGSTCNELREYNQGGLGAKPIINAQALAGKTLFSSAENSTNGGWRFMNLRLQGAYDPSGNHGNDAFFFYTWVANTYIHDMTVENVDMDGFDTAIYDANNADINDTYLGNHFTNSAQWGFLGGSSNLNLSYNSFINNGSGTTFLHSIYLSSNNNTASNSFNNVSIVGNFISGFSNAGGATQCVGEPFVAHAAVTNLVVSGNVVVEAANSNPQCYGISFSNGNNFVAYYRNALFSNNITVNTGWIGMAIDNCPNCVIENNLVIQNTNTSVVGIASPAGVSRPQDDIGTHEKIINNTVYFGINNNIGMGAGIKVTSEGSGHIIANNTVMYAASSSTGGGTSCFYYPLPLSSYSFIDNNNCFSNYASTVWSTDASTSYSKSSWLTHAMASGFDQASTLANPGWNFSTPLSIPTLDENKTGAQLFAPYFTPSGAPLVGAGNAANAPATDITNTARPSPPGVGAFQ